MAKNLNTQIWTIDNDGYVQTTQNLFTSTPPVYTHADHIDTSFNFCVNGVPSQSKRAVLHLTDRTNNVYTVENIDNIFIPNNLYDEKGNNYSHVIHKFIGTNGGVSNFSISADSQNQPSGGTYKTRVNFDYLSSIWSPRLNIRTYDTERHSVGSDNFKTLNDMDAVCTNSDALENETWWEYCARNESKYILTMDRYNDGVYITNGAFQSTSVFEGQTRVGITAPRISWLSTPHSYGNSYGTSDCIIYYGNGRDQYADMTFDVLLSLSLSDMVKKDEWDDTQYNKPRHNVLYGIKIDKNLILSIISSYGLPFSFKQQTNISIGNIDYALPEIKNNTTTGNYFRGQDAITADTDNNRWANTKDIDNKPASGGGSSAGDNEVDMPTAYIGGTAGMVTFYEINKTGLANADDISEAISRFDITTIGKDLLRNLISYKCFAVINTTDTVDRQITIAGHGLEDSGGGELTGRVIGGVEPINLFATSGGVTIPTLYNDYRDYEPYTRIQMYVPFCGWFDLPSWCIGKKITGTMFTDLYNGTVKAVIYASQTVVAEVGGCCAYDIPFVADATGMKAGAVISSALTTAAAVGATVATPNIATGIAAVSSAANLAASLNGNATTLKGVLGDGSNLNGLLNVYIKVTRPKAPNFPNTSIPDSYKHEIGVPTMKEIQISAGDGYIQVMDAKVNGTMTAREKQMIIEGFRHGLNF